MLKNWNPKPSPTEKSQQPPEPSNVIVQITVPETVLLSLWQRSLPFLVGLLFGTVGTGIGWFSLSPALPVPSAQESCSQSEG